MQCTVVTRSARYTLFTTTQFVFQFDSHPCHSMQMGAHRWSSIVTLRNVSGGGGSVTAHEPAATFRTNFGSNNNSPDSCSIDSTHSNSIDNSFDSRKDNSIDSSRKNQHQSQINAPVPVVCGYLHLRSASEFAIHASCTCACIYTRVHDTRRSL